MNNPLRFIDLDGMAPGDRVDIKNVTNSFNDGKTGKTYTLTIYVKEVKTGSRQDFSIGLTGVNVGHTFVGLNKTNEDGSSVTQVVGFYPDGKPSPSSPETKGAFGDDSNHSYDVSITITLTEDQFNNALSTMNLLDGTNYNLNTNNCTNFGMIVANSVGVDLPNTKGTWPGNGKGNDPADLGEDIRKMSNTCDDDDDEDYQYNTTGGSAPIATGDNTNQDDQSKKINK